MSDEPTVEYSKIDEIYDIIDGFSNLSDLNDIEGPHFADEEGFAYTIAYEFSSFVDEKKSISTNQLRKIFKDIKDLERLGNWEDAKVGFNLIRPKLAISAYRKSSGKTLINFRFYQLITKAMSKVEVKDDLDLSYSNLVLFSKFFEAIVAYHNFHEDDYKFKGNSKSPNNFDIEKINEIKKIISGFDSLRDLEELGGDDEPTFESEDGLASEIAYQFSKNGKPIKDNQIRRFYGEIKRIERYGNWQDAETDFILFKARLANSAARKLIPYEFYDIIRISMNKVYEKGDDDEKFKNLKLFVRFFEAIVGFHKFYNL